MLRIYVCLLPFEMLIKRSFTSYFVCYGLLSFTFAALIDFNFPFVYLWVLFLLISLSLVTPHSIFLVYFLKVLVDLSLVFFLFFLLAFKFIFLGFSVWYCLFLPYYSLFLLFLQSLILAVVYALLPALPFAL